MTINVTEQETSRKPQYGDVVLSVNGVSKKFCRDLKRSLLYGVQDITTELMGSREKNKKLRLKEFWALKDVSLQLRRGEALALVGPNGSGKTTLLRIISGLIKLDTGSVEVKGRLAPLIALGAGFNPILTGRENVHTNMSILGLSKKEINQRFQDVLDFAEIGDAIDAPVQSYSSGMSARLGFASAIHTEPDILLLDEVLAVGDVRFKAKCYRKLHELRQKGISFIMVSHSSHSIATVCETATYFYKGQQILSGDTLSVLNKYEEDLFLSPSKKTLGFLQIPEKPESESGGLDVVSVFFRDKNGEVIDSPVSGELTYLVLDCKVTKKLHQVSLTIGVRELAGETRRILYINSCDDDVYLDISPGKQEIQIQMPYFGLGMGVYDARIAIRMEKLYLLDKIDSFNFAVKKARSQSDSTMFYQPRTWNVVSSKN